MKPSNLSRILYKTMDALKTKETELSIKAPWGKIAALTWGSQSDPPVLLCHGKLDTCSGFRPLVSMLPSCFYYVSIDLPGNGRSDHLPPGVRYTVVDLVSSILCTVKHFNWKKFIYIGHSLGVPVGKYFNIVYPGFISRTVELDPVPGSQTWPSTRQGIFDWYHRYYAYYDEVVYAKHNGGPETAPKYTYDKAQQLVMASRHMPKDVAEHVLERCLESVGNGLYRFTFDQRMKEVTIIPFTPANLKEIYTTATTPTLCVLASKSIENGDYTEVKFVMDEAAWPNNNYKVKIVEGWHDVHMVDPGCMADDIARFLMEDITAKL